MSTRHLAESQNQPTSLEHSIKNLRILKKQVMPKDPLEHRKLTPAEKSYVERKLEVEIKQEEYSINAERGNLISIKDDEDLDASRASQHRLTQRTKTLLRKTAALTRLRMNQSGVCVGCGKDIEVGRQMTCPVSEHCIECKKQ